MKPNYHLRRERERHGWSQAKVGELIGTEAVTVGRWERGISLPYPYFREKLCQLFDKSAQELGFLADKDATQSQTPTNIIPSVQEVSTASSRLYDSSMPLPLLQPLIGRDELLLTLKQRLFQSRSVFALHGLPGVGKTTLATQLAYDEQVLAHFPDGVLWAGLGPQPNIIAHFSHWGKLLSISPEEMTQLHDFGAWARTLRTAIGLRKFLLILDDAWQDEAALALKVGGPNCTHLLTTRSPQLALFFADKGSMRVPELTPTHGMALLTHYLAEMSKSEQEIASELVETVGGLPLALTLMGKYISMQGHGGQVRRRHTAMTRLRNVGERLRLALPQSPLEQSSSLTTQTPLSLQALIEVSVQPLPAQVQHAFFALSVFPAKPNTFSEEAALAVCAETSDVLDLLNDTGLLESESTDRYRLHQTILDYARTHIQNTSSTIRMVTYYVNYIEQHAQDDEALEQETENILAALELAQKLDMQEKLVQGVLAFVPSLQRRGLYALANIHLQRTYRIAQEQQNMLALAHILLLQGENAEWRGEHTEAETYLQQGLAFARQVDHQEHSSALLAALGMVAIQRGEYAQAETYLHEGLTIARQLPQPERCSELLRFLGILYTQQGNIAQAQVVLQEGLTFAQQAQQPEHTINVLVNLGMTAKAQNNLQQAEAYYMQALAIARQSDLHRRIGFLFVNLGQLAEQKEDFVRAEQLFREGLLFARQVSYGQQICLLLMNLANTLCKQSNYEEAVRASQEGLALAQQLELRQESSMLFMTSGKIFTAQGDYVQADSQLQAALTLAQDLDTQWLVTMILYEIGEMYLKSGCFEKAETTFTALYTSPINADSTVEAWLHYKLACIAAAQGNIEKAHALGRKSLHVLEDRQPT